MAAALVELLQVEGVEHVFGIPGGALVALQVALKKATGITAHVCHQESGAGYIADGYARVKGGLGVVVVTSGPGATNALTAAMNAHASHTPFLVITGEVGEKFFGHGFLQEGADAGLDIVGVYRNALAYSEMITSPANLSELFAGAMRRSFEMPGQATHLSLPGDVAGAPLPGFTAPASPRSYRPTGSVLDSAGVDEAVASLVGAKRPLLMLGNRCRRALRDPQLLADLTAAVEHLSLPVMTSPDAKGIFPESHELSLRNYGQAGCPWPRAYMTAPGGPHDALVVIGSQLGQLTTSTWDPTLLPAGPFVQVDEDASLIGQAFPITLGVVSSTDAALGYFVQQAMAATVDPAVATARRALVTTIKQGSPFADPTKRVSTADPIKPQAVMRLINEAIEPGGHIMVDAGNCVGWCINEMVVDPPTSIHTALSMGPMGFAMSVIGAKLADPSATCMAVIGDGAFMMHAAEIATAAQNQIGAIFVVLADHQLQMVSQGMAAVTGDKTFEGYYETAWNDLAAVAQGFGAAVWTVSSVDEVTAALRDAIAGSAAGVPQVIVVEIDTTEMPPYVYPPPPPPPPAPT